MQAVIGFESHGHMYEVRTMPFSRRFKDRFLIGVKFCAGGRLDGLYGPKTFADEPLNLPGSNSVVDFHEGSMIRPVLPSIRKNHSVPNVRIECDLHRYLSILGPATS